MSERQASFADIVAPLRAEFALDPVTGLLAVRRPRPATRLMEALAVLGCLTGTAMLPPAAGHDQVDDLTELR